MAKAIKTIKQWIYYSKDNQITQQAYELIKILVLINKKNSAYKLISYLAKNEI